MRPVVPEGRFDVVENWDAEKRTRLLRRLLGVVTEVGLIGEMASAARRFERRGGGEVGGSMISCFQV